MAGKAVYTEKKKRLKRQRQTAALMNSIIKQEVIKDNTDTRYE